MQSVSSAPLFYSLQRGGCGSILQPAPFALADVFLLGRELGAGFLFSAVGFSPFSCFLLAHQDAKGHHSKISALASWWQQECCTDGCSAAVRSSRHWQQGLSSLAHSSPPANRWTDDGGWRRWKVAACHCHVMLCPWYLSIELNVTGNAWG